MKDNRALLLRKIQKRRKLDKLMDYFVSIMGWTKNDNVKAGQTLIEIIVAIGVVVLLVTGLVAGATGTLKAAQYGRAKSLAVRYSQQAMEVTRTLRDTSWDLFSAYGSVIGITWCLDKAGVWTQASGSCLVNIDNIYTRTVIFTWQDPKMKVDVSTTWTDFSHTYRVDQTTFFTQWQ